MRLTKTTALAMVLAISATPLATVPALAQSNTGQQNQQNQQTQSQRQSQTQQGQTQQGQSGQQRQGKVDLSSYSVSNKKNDFLAETLLDSTAYGPDGDSVGTVQNIIVGRDGRIERVILEVGGFLDIGDKIISVPWNQVSITPGEEGIDVPVRADNVESFSLFGDKERSNITPGSFRVDELIGDYVTLQDGTQFGENFGYITDLIFNRRGKLQTLVVVPDSGFGTSGYYGMPYYGYDANYWYDYDPGLNWYGVPYTRDDVTAAEPFDYGGFDNGII